MEQTTRPIGDIAVAAAPAGDERRLRVLGPVDIMMLGIGSVIGTGIFVLTGQAAAAHAGPAIVLSMVLAAVAAGLAGLCYAELASALPVAGSAYTYARHSFGDAVAWIIGWDLMLEYALSAATVAVGWSANLVSLLGDFGIALPARLAAAPGTPMALADGTVVTALFNLPAFLVVLVVTGLLVLGLRESARVNGAIVALKVLVILVVVSVGARYVRRELWHPFISANTGLFGEFGWSGVFRGTAVIFFAYIGFDAVSTVAHESRRPERDMPVGLLGTLAICATLYVAVSAVMVGLISYRQLGVAAPMALAMDAARAQAGGVGVVRHLALLVKVGTLLGLSSTVVVTMLAQTRIFYSMARDGFLPAWAGALHPRLRTPHWNTLATGIAVALAAALTPIGVLGQLVSIGTLLAFIIVALGIIVLRRTRPELPRRFRVPLVPWVPILSALVSFGLMLTLPRATWIRLLVWMGLGLAIYALRRRALFRSRDQG